MSDSRLPLSRARSKPGTAGHASRLEHARSFLPKTMEGRPLEIMFPAARKSGASYVPYAQGALPLRSRPVEAWPESCTGDCLQCGEGIATAPLPACNYKELERYWIFGQFCRPCCALGYVLEHWGEAGATRCLVWTRQMLSVVFGVPSSCSPSPPRFMLRRYGGPLDLATFYGEDAQRTQYKAMRAPPLASFAMYMECVRGSAQQGQVAEMPSLDSLRNLRRPQQREFPLVTRQPTGRPPLLLELLATKFVGLAVGEPDDEEALPITSEAKRPRKAAPEQPARPPARKSSKQSKLSMGLQEFFAAETESSSALTSRKVHLGAGPRDLD